MRIIDWSSDVCSSDLREDELQRDFEPLLLEEAELDGGRGGEIGVRDQVGDGQLHLGTIVWRKREGSPPRALAWRRRHAAAEGQGQIGRETGRESVGAYV